MLAFNLYVLFVCTLHIIAGKLKRQPLAEPRVHVGEKMWEKWRKKVTYCEILANSEKLPDFET